MPVLSSNFLARSCSAGLIHSWLAITVSVMSSLDGCSETTAAGDWLPPVPEDAAAVLEAAGELLTAGALVAAGAAHPATSSPTARDATSLRCWFKWLTAFPSSLVARTGLESVMGCAARVRWVPPSG